MAKGGKQPGAGRPAGVPNKVRAELADLARNYTDEALKALVRILRDSEAPEAAVVAAANAILDRGHGKPRQSVELKATIGLEQLVSAALGTPMIEGEIADGSQDDEVEP